MAVSLDKLTDQDPWYPNQTYMDNEAWNSTVLLPMFLSTVYPSNEAVIINESLRKNDLMGFSILMQYKTRYDNATGELV